MGGGEVGLVEGGSRCLKEKNGIFVCVVVSAVAKWPSAGPALIVLVQSKRACWHCRVFWQPCLVSSTVLKRDVAIDLLIVGGVRAVVLNDHDNHNRYYLYICWFFLFLVPKMARGKRPRSVIPYVANGFGTDIVQLGYWNALTLCS